MSEEQQQSSWKDTAEKVVKDAIENTNNFSNELHQMQDSLFNENAQLNQNNEATPEIPTTSSEQANETTNQDQTNTENLQKEINDKQIIQVSPEVEDDQQQNNENPERKIEVFNNIAGLNQPNPQAQIPKNVPIRQRIANWYTSLEKRVGEAEAKESLVSFIKNVSAFVVGSFFVSTIAEYIDNLK